MSTSSKIKSDVDQLDDLVKDLLTEVNRPINNNNNNNNNNPGTIHRYSYQRQTNNDLINPQRTKTTREERIRIKRGNATDIPVETSSSSMTTTTKTTTANNNKSEIPSASIDEHLIDSLLESVQNTLKKRAERNQSNWSTDIPISNRRTYSSSATYNDSVHRMDPLRGRFPIKINRTDSPTSTISSRRPYSRQDSRDGYTSASTTAIPTHYRATSEPPPDGPIELRRMDLIRSPSRTYFEPYPPPPPPPADYYYQYSRSTLPTRGIHVRGRDYSGYDTDTGITTSYGYGPRYYRVPPPPPPPPPPPQPMYPYYRQYDSQRSMFRPDGYDTDSGLVSSGRLHMTRTLPQRMAAIPETVVVNNRIHSSSNLNTLPPHLRTSSFLNQNVRRENFSGYETDSGMNTRQYRQVPVDIQTTNNTNQRYQQTQEQFRSASIPVYSQQSQQQYQQQTTTKSPAPSSSMETVKKDVTYLPKIFPGSVGLSNPLNENKSEQIDIKRKISNDNITKRTARPHAAVIDNTIIQTSINPEVTKTTTTEIVTNTNVDTQQVTKTPTFPLINQSYNANVQSRVGNSSNRTQDESSRRSSVSSTADSDVSRTGAYQAHNVSRFWYKEKMSREDAVNLLKTKPAGTFLIRDSQGFPGSYGLAVKVDALPPGIHSKPGADPQAELVRHYLIERTPTGHVRLKGCPNEPDFANLSALIYQHTVTPLALPTKLVLPSVDIAQDYRPVQNNLQPETKKMSIKDLLEKGAACNVIYLNNVDVESLSGQMAVAKALRTTYDNPERLQATVVNFKVSNAGITLTDTKKKLFSRRHFPKEYVTYCGLDYETDRYWTYQFSDLDMLPRAKCFGFVSKKINGTKSSQPENECHIFAELDPTQPSSAIVNFVSKVMIGSVPV